MLHIALCETTVVNKLIAIKLYEERILQVQKKISFPWVSFYLLNILQWFTLRKSLIQTNIFYITTISITGKLKQKISLLISWLNSGHKIIR